MVAIILFIYLFICGFCLVFLFNIVFIPALKSSYFNTEHQMSFRVTQGKDIWQVLAYQYWKGGGSVLSPV